MAFDVSELKFLLPPGNRKGCDWEVAPMIITHTQGMICNPGPRILLPSIMSESQPGSGLEQGRL